MVNDKYEPQVGDWVRYIRNNELRIAVIEYIHLDPYGYHKYSITTTNGVISESDVLETRREAVTTWQK